jgi:hypothetical protein
LFKDFQSEALLAILIEVQSSNTILKEDHPMSIMKKKIFKDFQFSNQSEAMVAILDVG